jgi:hypothetical protein
VYTLLRVVGSDFQVQVIAETSAIASNAAIVGVREAPYTTGRSNNGQLQQQLAML